ncbi:pre-peptidase C-terminal domain-containing protein [Herbaspirillum sp. ST 5-3]|uniref:pre-peptidase C-terminal domain-containing protein n=1 Tax=Oxalobacteraceae TaxID=75682 RepID=UPI0010A3AA0C|nr:pre-peptidase C-terminal domain-containing protein [Herbaspirillum sp. ST 5-3]
MAVTDYYPLVQKFYVAYFGRPADAGGLNNMASMLNAANAPTNTLDFVATYDTNPTVRAIIDSFGNSDESAALYTGNTREFVTAIYHNVVGREPDEEGLNWWADRIDSGVLPRSKAALNMMGGAEANTEPQGLIDAALVANRIAAASYFTSSIDSEDDVNAYSGYTAAAAAREMLNAVNSSTPASTYQSLAANALSNMASHSIDTSGEIDNNHYSLVAGHSYRIEVQAAAGSALDPEIVQVRDPSDNPVANATNADYGISQNAQLTFSPTSTGDYNICVQGQNSTTGQYVVTVADLDVAAGNTDSQTSISAGQTYSGTVSTGFQTRSVFFNLTAGQEYQFTLQSAASGDALNTPVLQGIYDESGKQLAGSYGQAADGTLTLHITPTSSGNYYGVISDSYDDTGGFTFIFSEVAGNKAGRGEIAPSYLERSVDTVAGDASTGSYISAGTPVTGTIDSYGDEDWYGITMLAGVTYTIRMQGEGANAGTLHDPVINGVYYSYGSGTIPAYLGGFNDDSGGGTTHLDAMSTFTPSSSGTYYIAASSYSSYTGTFTLSVSASGGSSSGDIAANTTTTGSVSVGGSVSGTIDSSSDADWYGVTLTAGNIYTIRLQGSHSDNGTLSDPLISGVYNSSGTLIYNTYADDQDGMDSRLSFSPTTSGTYYIAAEGWGSSTGTFHLSVAQTASDVAGSTSTTSSLPVGGSTTVTIDQAYDQDWYAITLTAGNTYQFTLSGSGGNTAPVIYGIYDASGNYDGGYATGASNGSSYTATASFTPMSSGTYYVDAYSYYAGNYTLSATQTAADVAANVGTTGTVSVGGSVTGTIDTSSDADWYGVSLTANTTYTIRLQGSGSSNGTLYDPLISGIYDANGVYVSNTYADDQDGRDSSINFTPSSTGTYYISAEGYSNYTGTFRLSVNDSGSSDIAANTNTTGTVAVGGSVTGTIGSTTDADWYAVNLTAGSTYTVRMQGSGSSNGTLYDPLISGIYNSGGVLVANTYADDQDGRDSRLDFTPTSSGTYYVSAEGYGSYTGTFRLSVEQQSNSDLAASTATTGVVFVNSSATSTIDVANDQDWFAVNMTAGTRYQIDLEGSPTNSGTLMDPYLRGIYDSSGHLISGTTNDDSGEGANSRVTFDATSSGTYYISAGAYSTGTGTYALSVTSQGVTDIPADLTTTASVTAGGSVDSLVNEAGDRDWFAVSLTAGQTYTIDLQPKANSTTPLNDPYLYGIYNSSGSLISGTTDDDSGTGASAQVTYTATSSGTYYISAGGYSNHTGNYVLSVSSGSSTSSGSTTSTADLAASTSTTGTVSVGGSASSLIGTAGDQDWFAVNLSAGHSYNISLAGAASGNGTLTDAYLRGIYDSTGLLITGTTDDDSGYGSDALVTFSPTSSGTYYISAGGYASSTGTYALTVSENASTDTGSTTPTPSSGSQGTWTVMVYVDGDNNLESFALSDVNEMEAASLPQNVRVAALVDRIGGYSSADGNWTDSRFGLLSHDNDLNHVSSNLTSWGERNMGSTSTLTEFINASAQAAPADHYALVIWDHGGGIAGVAWDDTSYSANLSLNEVSQAISASSVTHFDMIGFDACLQGVLDQGYALRTQTDYVVVSEDTEPGDGWDYTNWLSLFQQQASPSGSQLATQAVNSYESFYQAQGNNQVTLAALNASEVGDLATAWDNFAQAVSAAGSSAMQTLRSARSTALDFQNDTYVDLHSLMTNFMQLNAVGSLDTAAQSVLTALSDAVVDTGGLTTAHGVTVYMPQSSHSGYLNATEYPIVGLTGMSSFYSSFWA